VELRQQWEAFPYASGTSDIIRDDGEARAGVDLAWRPSSNLQLTATINPDFGSVESDDVVVNLTAYETYFPEKRLFFLEGTEVFETTPRSRSDWSGPKEKTRNAREAVSFMIFFGEKKIESGFFLAPDLPYFISFFLGENEKPDKVYYANYWQEGGRYLCIPCDGTKGKTFLTEVNVSEKFKILFGKDPPPVSGLAIEVDVQNTEFINGRHSKAFIKQIKLYQ